MIRLLSQKSSSCPDLTLYRLDDEFSKRMSRKRTMSECVYNREGMSESEIQSSLKLNRTQSDSDLTKIDREKTFAALNINVDSSDLLARVANALGNLIPTEIEPDNNYNTNMYGVQGFSDSQILASERTWSGWSNNTETPPVQRHPRKRTCSEMKIPIDDPSNDSYEWTWSGSKSHIKDLRKLRQKSQYDDLYRSSFHTGKNFGPPLPTNENTVISIQPPSESSSNYGSNRFLDKINIFKKRNVSTNSNSNFEQQLPSNIHEDAIKYLQATSKAPYSRKQSYSGGSRRPSTFETVNSNQSQTVLENTTIADLIRALEQIHTEVTGPDASPKRKLGTASLTPPEFPSIFGLFEPDRASIQQYSTVLENRRPSLRPGLPNFSRRPSAVAVNQTYSGTPKPPPYSSLKVTDPFKRRFSVRPISNNPSPTSQSPVYLSVTSLASNPSSSQQQPPVARKVSYRPSPLARQMSTQSNSPRGSSRFNKPIPLQREVISQNARRRQESMSMFPERPIEGGTKRRTESK